MGRTMFMVVKAKELIKTAVFAVLGVIILVGLIAFFLNMGKHDGAYRDGTYYEEMQLGEETAEIAATGQNAILTAEVLSFGRLAPRVFSKKGIGNRLPLGDIGKAMALRKILLAEKDNISYFHSVLEQAER